MTERHPAGKLAEAIADRLASPDALPESTTSRPWWRQSLAHGAPGLALLHIELAAHGLRSWQRAHAWLTYAARAPLTTGPDSHLFYGAPALAHALACAAAGKPGCYERALGILDRTVAAHVRLRIKSAQARIDAARLPALAEFDVVRGLTGLGSYLLRREPGGEELRAVLEYLVRLTKPIRSEGETLPGWWTRSGPDGRVNGRFPGGHSNSGVAHGISGPLSLLALSALKGVMVDGQREAIHRICAWFDRWRTDTESGALWPYWVNRHQLRAGHRRILGRQRPSWCYGVAGLARAQQLAALATGDSGRRAMAENALVQALADPGLRLVVGDSSLCHGFAGLALVAIRVADDACPQTAAQLYALVPGLLDAVQPVGTNPAYTADVMLSGTRHGSAFLEGAAGVALAVLAPSTSTLPRSVWDTCLLIA